MTSLDENPLREALILWAVAFCAILATYATAPFLAKPVAVLAFLYLPLWAMRRRGEDYQDYGVSFRAWREDLTLLVVVCLIVLPLFTAGFWLATVSRPNLPVWAQSLLSPMRGEGRVFHAKLPDKYYLWVVDQLFVVALPEEFFYRGYLQARLKLYWPKGARVFGATLGPAFLLTAVLFALGHLAVFQVWRLGVFFPALLFGYMRERTGTVLGSTLLHAIFNLYEMFLRESFTPQWQRR